MLLLRKLSQTCSFQLPAKTKSDVITISGNPSTSSTINRTKEDHKVTRTPMDYLLERLCLEATWILLLPLSSNPISENQTKKSTISHPIFPGKKKGHRKKQSKEHLPWNSQWGNKRVPRWKMIERWTDRPVQTTKWVLGNFWAHSESPPLCLLAQVLEMNFDGLKSENIDLSKTLAISLPNAAMTLSSFCEGIYCSLIC